MNEWFKKQHERRGGREETEGRLCVGSITKDASNSLSNRLSDRLCIK